jgi:signal transduction histidine kinase
MAMMRSLRCGLITVDGAAIVRHLNEPARAILGLGAAARTGIPVAEALRDHPQLARLLAEGLTLHTLPDRAEMEIRCGAGQERTIGFTLTRVEDDAGEVHGTALWFKDLTPIEQEREREQLQERLAALGTMAASLAHEIRNPLAALEVSLTLLRRRLGAAGPEADLAVTLQEQVRRLSAIVNTSLEYVRPLGLAMAPVDVAALVEDAVTTACATRSDGRVEVRRHYAGHVGARLADADRLRQAFLNVLRNAVEALGPGGGTVDIEVGMGPEAGAPIVIAVADDGPGIPEEVRPRIFHPFFSTKPEGSGLGLAWTRKVVDAHGGVVDVDSRPGEGTVFTLRLPLPPAPPIVQTTAAIGETR